MGREFGVLPCFCGDCRPSLGFWGWKWVPAALLHPDRPGCSFHSLLASRRREDGGNPFLGAPEQLRDRQSRTETVLAFAQRPSPKGRCFLYDQVIKMVLSPFKALWGICAFPWCRDVSVCVPPLFSDRGRRGHGSAGSHFAPNIVMLTSCGVRQGEAG